MDRVLGDTTSKEMKSYALTYIAFAETARHVAAFRTTSWRRRRRQRQRQRARPEAAAGLFYLPGLGAGDVLQLVEQLPSPSPVTTAPLASRRRRGPGRQHRATRSRWSRSCSPASGSGGFWTSVQLRSPRAPYPSAWPAKAGPARPSLGACVLPSLFSRYHHAPDGDSVGRRRQAVTPYLNGFRVGAPPELPPYAAQANLAPAATGQAVPTGRHVGLVAGAGPGMNTMGLEVVNLADRAPSFQARIELNFGAGTVVMGTSRRLAFHDQRGVDRPGVPRVGDVQRA